MLPNYSTYFPPIFYKVDEKVIEGTGAFLKERGFENKNILVVSGQVFSKQYAQELAGKNKWETYILESNTFASVEKLKNLVRAKNFELLIAVGGGTVLDGVKRVGFLTDTPLVAVPTIISNDGLISPISVLKNRFGRTESIRGKMPIGILIDLDIIQKAPVRFLRAAAGDVLSNISAINDWDLAIEQGKQKPNYPARHLAISAANMLLNCSQIDLKDIDFMRLLIRGQIYSGVAMELTGNSRPCSGSEHLISHALDYLGLAKELHGTQVASISLFTLYLQKRLEKKHLEYAEKTKIPFDFLEDYKGCDLNLFGEIIQKAREMRLGRYTILDHFSNKELYENYKEYVKKLEHYKTGNEKIYFSIKN